MKSPIPTLAAAALLGLTPVAAHAQSSQAARAEQTTDNAECSAEAISETGFDPVAPPPTPGQASARAAGSGAGAGGATQSAPSRQGASAQNQTAAQQQQSGRTAYNKAKTACMTARGYRAGQQP